MAKRGRPPKQALAETRKFLEENQQDIAELAPEINEKLPHSLFEEDTAFIRDTLQTHRAVDPQKKGGVSHSKIRHEEEDAFLIGDEEEEDPRLHLKAAAQAALLLGQDAGQVALQYGFSSSTVKTWQDTIITVSAIGRRDRLSEMLLVYIEEQIKSLMAISMITSREKWVMGQNAANLATYFAVVSDRVFQLLTAFSRTQETRERYASQLEVIDQNLREK